MLDKLIQLGIGGACLAVMYALLRFAIAKLVDALTAPLRSIEAGIRQVLLELAHLRGAILPPSSPAPSSTAACVVCGAQTEYACVDCSRDDHELVPLCPAPQCRTTHDEHDAAAVSYRTTQPMRPGVMR